MPLDEPKQELEAAEVENTSDNSENVTEGESFVEKDGEIYLSTDALDEEKTVPESALEKGQSEEDKQVVASEEQSINPTYAGKNVEELIEMHQNATAKISEQGEELGSLRKSVQPDEMTPEQLFQAISAQELEQGLVIEQATLAGLDPDINEKEYIEQKYLVDSMHKDWVKKLQTEAIDTKFNQIDNEVFIAEQKQKLQDAGIKISDDDFQGVTENAKHYLEGGKLTDRSYHKSLIDKYGTDMVTKYFQMSGEKKAREEITNAKGKVVTKVDVKGSGKNAKLVNIKNLSQREMNKLFNDPNMTTTELQRLYDSINK